MLDQSERFLITGFEWKSDWFVNPLRGKGALSYFTLANAKGFYLSMW